MGTGMRPSSDSGSDYSGKKFDDLVAEMMAAKHVDRRTASRFVLKSFSEQEREAYLASLPPAGSRDS